MVPLHTELCKCCAPCTVNLQQFIIIRKQTECSDSSPDIDQSTNHGRKTVRILLQKRIYKTITYHYGQYTKDHLLIVIMYIGTYNCKFLRPKFCEHAFIIIGFMEIQL